MGLLVQPSGAKDAPGRAAGLKDKALGAVESLVQNFKPVNQIHQHVCGYHGYAHDMTRQVRPRQAGPPGRLCAGHWLAGAISRDKFPVQLMIYSRLDESTNTHCIPKPPRSDRVRNCTGEGNEHLYPHLTARPRCIGLPCTGAAFKILYLTHQQA